VLEIVALLYLFHFPNEFSGLEEILKSKYFILLNISIFLVISCNIFEFSPYETDNGEFSTNIIQNNLAKISKITLANPDSFKFALIADTHSYYDEFNNAVKSINSNSEILFVIHAGDITEFGLLKEYKWANEIITKIKVPCFTVIGNHDCLSNGKQIYNKIFGSTFYSFVINENDPSNKYKFIFINDNTLEYEIAEEKRVRAINWLKENLSDNTLYKGIFVIAHVPPFADHYFNDDTEEEYRSILENGNVNISIHGHIHNYLYSNYYNDGVMYLVGDDISDRNYCIVTVYSDTSFNVERIYY